VRLAEVAQVGEALGGLSAFGGLVYAIASLKRWKRERLAEKRAEVAGRAYIALIQACNLLAVWAESCSTLLRAARSEGTLGGAGLGSFRSHHQWRDEGTREAVSEVRVAANSTAVYLEDSELQLLMEVRPLWEQIRTLGGPIGAAERPLSDMMLESLVVKFDGYAEEARALRHRAKSLRDTARFERLPAD